MSVEMNKTLSDMLQELGNIGCSHALTALSKLTSTEFIIRAPQTELIEYSHLPKHLGNVEEETVSIMLDVSGDLEAIFLLLFRPGTAVRILQALGAKLPPSFYDLDTITLSALLEMGNIMCSSYMNAVYQLTGMESSLSVPSYAMDMLGSILSLPVIRIAAVNSQTLYIRNVFTIEGEDWIGSTLLLPTFASAEKLKQSLEALL